MTFIGLLFCLIFAGLSENSNPMPNFFNFLTKFFRIFHPQNGPKIFFVQNKFQNFQNDDEGPNEPEPAPEDRNTGKIGPGLTWLDFVATIRRMFCLLFFLIYILGMFSLLT